MRATADTVIAGRTSQPSSTIDGESPPADLVVRLCDALHRDAVRYCHWKSNAAIGRSASGENDLDLLVDRGQATTFGRIVSELGFMPLDAPTRLSMPGVMDFLGYDPPTDRFIHIQAHYQLILGHDATKNYRLPLEEQFLASAGGSGLLKLPTPEYEYVVFIVRMVLKHSSWDAMVGRQGRLSATELDELADLQARAEPDAVRRVVQDDLAPVDMELFVDCERVVRRDAGFWRRARVARRLQKALQVHARRSRFHDLRFRLFRRVAWPLRSRVLGSPPKYRFGSGGAILAVIGGDGSGKSTAVKSVHEWLRGDLDVKCVHLGKPPWSATTNVVRGCLSVPRRLTRIATLGRRGREVGPVPTHGRLGLDGYTRLLWLACTARDRLRLYRRARRFTTQGGIVVSDRYPHHLLRSMDVPQIDMLLGDRSVGPVARWLATTERHCHEVMARAESMVVLRVDPEVAAERKTDEAPDYVRARCAEVWDADWIGAGISVIDANQPAEVVLAQLKSLLWADLAGEARSIP